VTRAGLVLLSLLALALGAGAASVLADTPPPATTTGTTTTTTTGDTTTAAVIPDGIVLGGVAVGGLTTDAAAVALQADFGRPLVLVLGHTKIKVAPGQLGMRLPLASATQRALTESPGTILGLRAGVDKSSVKAYVARLAKRYDRTVRNPELKLRGLKPYVSKPRVGHVLYQRALSAAVQSEVIHGTREPIVAKSKTIKPTTAPGTYGPVVVIQRSTNLLTLYKNTTFVRRFHVATGQAIYPTPLGRFNIIVKWKDPWWYPPNDAWAAGEKPTPPGPGNPLGTRWMGLDSPGVGIHGTPESGSIGYSESHGCIRMLIPQAEWLFDHVTVGTTVFILPS
jgi:lipoprotein-anchoring transpeptidase ErfK/SrfK